MFCSHCGSDLPDDAKFCSRCGAATASCNSYTNQYPNSAPPPTYYYAPPPPRPVEVDAPSGGFAVLCFFFPIVGLILYIIWHDQYPLKARSCGKGALISVIVNVIGSILYIIVIFLIAAIAASAPYYMLLPLI